MAKTFETKGEIKLKIEVQEPHSGESGSLLTGSFVW